MTSVKHPSEVNQTLIMLCYYINIFIRFSEISDDFLYGKPNSLASYPNLYVFMDFCLIFGIYFGKSTNGEGEIKFFEIST